MIKTVPVSFLVDELNDTLFLTDPQYIPDVALAVAELIGVAHKVYFLSIPNLDGIDWYNDAVALLDTKLKLAYSEEWYVGIYECCIHALEQSFDRWDMVTLRVRGGIITFNNKGDYRISKYHELFGSCRVGEQTVQCDRSVSDITDPFYVSDIVESEQSAEALSVTATSMVSAFSKVPDYLRLKRAGNDIKGLRGLSRDHLQKAKELAESVPTRISYSDRRRVGESEREWLHRMGEKGRLLLARYLSDRGRLLQKHRT